ncbi:hypothetical protein M5K25_018073 [Dendrobium thyrsiflorum]|uniref:Uncharacterized protein n=1 Tax=Dendrobium thyrsiflorum TaxID=117978 RepID=A0ABD0UH51_DENTH
MDSGTDLGSAHLVPGYPAIRQGKPGHGVGLGYGLRLNSHLGQFRVDYAVNALQRKTFTSGGLMVAFAGRKYAARSLPIFVGNTSYEVTSFTLVLEFQKGTLQNLYLKHDDCSSCSGKSNFVCLNNQDCAIKASNCQGSGQAGSVDCSIGIQLAFSGTDKHYAVLNSWYEVLNLRQYSLYRLYSNLKDSLTVFSV